MQLSRKRKKNCINLYVERWFHRKQQRIITISIISPPPRLPYSTLAPSHTHHTYTYTHSIHPLNALLYLYTLSYNFLSFLLVIFPLLVELFVSFFYYIYLISSFYFITNKPTNNQTNQKKNTNKSYQTQNITLIWMLKPITNHNDVHCKQIKVKNFNDHTICALDFEKSTSFVHIALITRSNLIFDVYFLCCFPYAKCTFHTHPHTNTFTHASKERKLLRSIFEKQKVRRADIDWTIYPHHSFIHPFVCFSWFMFTFCSLYNLIHVVVVVHRL